MPHKAFSDLESAEELISYLNKPLMHMRYSVFHYTSLESLLKIFRGKKLKFSHFDTTNDKIEADFVTEETKKKRFFCLMRSMEENFGMWAMYGGLTKSPDTTSLKDICVKIEFNVTELKAFIKEKNLKATAVAYTQIVTKKTKLNNIYSCGSCTNKKGISLYENREQLSGYIKDNAWKYEHEMRLWSENEFVDLSDAFLASLKIIPSPVSSVDECKNLIKESEYKDLLDVITPLFVENKYEGTYLTKK